MVNDVLNKNEVRVQRFNSFVVDQPAHSVRVLKVINNATPARPPSIHAQHPTEATSGETVKLAAHVANPDIAAVSYQWNFGDGVILAGEQVCHAYTHAGSYKVTLTAIGLDGLKAQDTFHLPVTGAVSTRFSPVENRRYPNSR